MARGYQRGFSMLGDGMFDREGRLKKAETIRLVLLDYFAGNITGLRVLNVGASSGIMDEYLADYVASITCVDIDEHAINFALQNFKKDNLTFESGDAMNLQFEDCSFDVVICSQVYEHVPDSRQLMREMYRVLKQGGVVYFAANNRLMIMEPHYRLPFLSWLPKFLADKYMKIAGRGNEYYEQHYTLWGLKDLVQHFEIVDYTRKTIESPRSYGLGYMLSPETRKHKVAVLFARHFYFLVPGYLWLLRKG